MEIEFTIPAAPGETFAPESFDILVGQSVQLEQSSDRLVGVINEALVSEDGKSVRLSVDIDDLSIEVGPISLTDMI